MFDIINSQLVKKQLECDNFLVEDTNSSNNICCIYFSSHGLYYPVTETVFEDKIVRKNYFEWYKHRLPNAKRHIFLRDIRLSFYVEGINKRCNSIDKLIELLKILADGYDVITIGSSAGGYMSALIGGVLNSKISFVFSGQFDLFSDFSFETKELLVKHQKDSEYSKWYDISSFYKSNMVYFCPVNSYCDKAQLNKLYNQVESNNSILEKVIIFPLKSSKHGVIINTYCLDKFFEMSFPEIYQFRQKFSSGIISPLILSIRLIGYYKTFLGTFKLLLNKIKNLRLKLYNYCMKFNCL